MTEWEPATEAEEAMREALRKEDQEAYFQVLARTALLLPVSGDTPSGGGPLSWGTWTTGGRTHVLAFTSAASLQACLAQHAGSTRHVPYPELASGWPNPDWWLAVNPGLPIEGYLPAWFVSQLARGDVRLPGRTMGARARLMKADNANRARATASVPGMTPPSEDEVAAAIAAPGLAQSAGTLDGTGLITSTEPSAGLPVTDPGPTRWAASPGSPATNGDESPARPADADPLPTRPRETVPAGGDTSPPRYGEAFPATPPRYGAGVTDAPSQSDGGLPRRPATEPAGYGAPDTDTRPPGFSPLPPRPETSTPPATGLPPFGSNAPARDLPPFGSNAPGTGLPPFGSNAPARDLPPFGSNAPGTGLPPFGSNAPAVDLPSFGSDAPAARSGTEALPKRPPGGESLPKRPGGGESSPRADFSPTRPAFGSPAPFRPAADPLAARPANDAPSQRPEGNGFTPSPENGGLPTRPEGGGPPPRSEGNGFMPRPDSSGFPQRAASGGLPPRPENGSSSARPEGNGFTPQPDSSGFSPRPDSSGFSPQSAEPAAESLPKRPPGGESMPKRPSAADAFKSRPAASAFPAAEAFPSAPASSDPPSRSAADAFAPRPATDPLPARPGPSPLTRPGVDSLTRPGPDSLTRPGPDSLTRPGVDSLLAARSGADSLLSRPGVDPTRPSADPLPTRPAADPLPARPAPAESTAPTSPAAPTSAPTPTSPAAPDAADETPAVGPGGLPRRQASATPTVYGGAVPVDEANDYLRGSAYQPEAETAAPERGPHVWAAPGEAPGYGAGSPSYTTQQPDAGSYAPDPDRPFSPAPSPAYRPESQTSSPPDLAGFVPANEVEEDLLAAAGDGSTDSFLSTLLLARVLLPLKPGSGGLGSRPGDPDFAWRTDVIDDERYVVVFTSPERLAEHLVGGDAVETVGVKFAQLIRHWPDPGLSFAVNPGSPVGATLPGSQIVALASWAKEVGLGEDAEPEEPVTAAPVRVAETPAPAFRAPDPNVPAVMQKTVGPEQVDYFLSRGYDRVSGFVHRANEVEHLSTPGQLLAALGLVYPGSVYRADSETVYLLRWPAYRPSLYRIPYGGQNDGAMRAMEGWVIERSPFRGNGFAPGDSSDVIAEFKVDSVRLPHGSELWSVDRTGRQSLLAVLDTDAMTWRKVGDR